MVEEDFKLSRFNKFCRKVRPFRTWTMMGTFLSPWFFPFPYGTILGAICLALWMLPYKMTPEEKKDEELRLILEESLREVGTEPIVV